MNVYINIKLLSLWLCKLLWQKLCVYDLVTCKTFCDNSTVIKDSGEFHMMPYYLTVRADLYWYCHRKVCESELYPTSYMCNSCACAPADYHNEAGLCT